MKIQRFFYTCLIAASIIFSACNNDDKKVNEADVEVKEPRITEELITYKLDTVTMIGYVAYDENIEGTRPAVIVLHEWWGLNDYPKMRARELAKLGYIAMAMDMYGNGQTANNPDEAKKMSAPFYQNPEMAKQRLDAAIARLKFFSQADSNKIAAIGYCFGGGILLNSARLGEDIKGVVSFHGSLVGTPADKNLLKADILVCHGAADTFVPQAQVDQFKKQMDSIGARYTFKSYEGATHAFTNPDADAKAKQFNMPISYNPVADSASWKDMKEFLGKIFQ
jgi:dienelactone hydrolase